MSRQKKLRRKLTDAARGIRAAIDIQERILECPENMGSVLKAAAKITELRIELSAVEAQLDKDRA